MKGRICVSYLCVVSCRVLVRSGGGWLPFCLLTCTHVHNDLDYHAKRLAHPRSVLVAVEQSHTSPPLSLSYNSSQFLSQVLHIPPSSCHTVDIFICSGMQVLLEGGIRQDHYSAW